MIRLARWLKRNAARKFFTRSCVDHISLFQSGVGSPRAHGDTDVRRRETGSIVNAVADHGDALILPGRP